MLGRCMIIGASPDITMPPELSITKDDFVVCADGGYQFALENGIIPDLIIGDFDSAEYPEQFSGETIRLPRMKDDTDTMFCVKECMSRGYSDFHLIGMTGGREDHTYANFCTMLYIVKNSGTARIYDSESEMLLLQDGSLTISGKAGAIFSVFPFGCKSCTVSLKGFLYELEKGQLTADFPLGVSNEITADDAYVNVHSGNALLMIRRQST